MGLLRTVGVAWTAALLAIGLVCWFVRWRWERRKPAGGFWDYGASCHEDTGAVRVIVVDQDGAGVLACATTPGDQLKHLECPLAGPCIHANVRASNDQR